MYSLYIRIVVMRICVIWFPYESYDPLDIGCSLYYLLSKQKPSWTWLDIDVFGVSLGPWVPWPCSPGKRSSTFCSLLPLPFQQHPCLTPIPSRNWPRHRRHARHVAWIEWNRMESGEAPPSPSSGMEQPDIWSLNKLGGKSQCRRYAKHMKLRETEGLQPFQPSWWLKDVQGGFSPSRAKDSKSVWLISLAWNGSPVGQC